MANRPTTATGGGSALRIFRNETTILTVCLPDGIVGEPYRFGIEVARAQGGCMWSVEDLSKVPARAGSEVELRHPQWEARVRWCILLPCRGEGFRRECRQEDLLSPRQTGGAQCGRVSPLGAWILKGDCR